MDLGLRGKIALVTAASRGLGRAIVEELAAEGAAVVMCARGEEALTKAQLASQIYNLIKSSRLTQSQAAKKLGIDQPKVSALLRGRLAGFSIERLFHFLNKLGQDIQINIRPANRRIPAIHVLTRKSA